MITALASGVGYTSENGGIEEGKYLVEDPGFQETTLQLIRGISGQDPVVLKDKSAQRK